MRRLIAAASLGILVGALPAPAQAANSLSVSSVTRVGGTVKVVGTATYDATSFPTLVEDPAGDDLLGEAVDAGGDLRGFSMNFEGDTLSIRWKANLEPFVGPAPGYVYAAAFAVNGQVAYEIEVARLFVPLTGILATIPSLWKCGGPDNCATRQRVDNTLMTAVMDPPGGYVTASIRNFVSPGDRITSVSLGEGSVVIGVGGVVRLAGYPQSDGVRTYAPNDWSAPNFGAYTAGLRVDAAVGVPSLDPTTLQYPTKAALGSGNSFSVSVSAEAGKVIYLRACHAASCSYASANAPA